VANDPDLNAVSQPENSSAIAQLLKQLAASSQDEKAKRQLRGRLRKLGHRGGLSGIRTHRVIDGRPPQPATPDPINGKWDHVDKRGDRRTLDHSLWFQEYSAVRIRDGVAVDIRVFGGQDARKSANQFCAANKWPKIVKGRQLKGKRVGRIAKGS
jgi:hypothetical protein